MTKGSKTRCQIEFPQITGFSFWVDMGHLFTVIYIIVCCLLLELNEGKFCKHFQGSTDFYCKVSYHFCVAAFKLRIACVASVSARVRRESWEESKKRNDGGGGGEFFFSIAFALTFAQELDWKRLLRRLNYETFNHMQNQYVER